MRILIRSRSLRNTIVLLKKKILIQGLMKFNLNKKKQKQKNKKSKSSKIKKNELKRKTENKIK